MAVSTDPNTGWSGISQYIVGRDPFSDNAYNASRGTWFQRSWWETYRWARKYVNINNIPVRLSEISFLACPGHSNGLRYGGSSSGALVGPANGWGCTFTVDLYVINGTSQESVTAASSVTLQSISDYNCYYGGYGRVSTVNDQTSFGSLNAYGPGTGMETDRNGILRYRHRQVFTFDNSPIIQPGQTMYIQVRPTNWAGGTLYDSLLVIQSDKDGFTGTVVPAETPYIWRFDGTSWNVELYAFRYNGTRWDKLDDNFSVN